MTDNQTKEEAQLVTETRFTLVAAFPYRTESVWGSSWMLIILMYENLEWIAAPELSEPSNLPMLHINSSLFRQVEELHCIFKSDNLRASSYTDAYALYVRALLYSVLWSFSEELRESALDKEVEEAKLDNIETEINKLYCAMKFAIECTGVTWFPASYLKYQIECINDHNIGTIISYY